MTTTRAALLLIACLAAAAASAQEPPRKGELDDVESRLREHAAEEKRFKNEASSREKEIAALRARMVEAANSVQASERRIAGITTELSALDAEEAKIAAALLSERKNLGDVLAALQSLEISRPPALLVAPNDANEAARAAMLLSGAAPELEARAKTLRDEMARLAAIREDRQRQREAFEKTNQEIVARRAVLADLLGKKQRERDVAASLATAAQQETAALAARATSLREVIDRLDRLASAIVPRLKPPPPQRLTPPPAAPSTPEPSLADAARQTARIREAYAPQTPFAKLRGALEAPVVGALAGKFGDDKPEGGKFEGVRFAVRDKAIIVAPHEGNVAFARQWGPLGNLVILDVGSGYHLLLIGVSDLLVQEGQKVTAGEPVGSVAAATPGGDAFLDFEIRRNSQPVNPSLWLAGSSSG